MSVLLDAGPVLNFLAVGQQNVLAKAADHVGLQMCAPARIDTEVQGMAKDPLFSSTAVAATWRKLTASGRISILSDELTPSVFTAAVTRISGVPAATRVRSRKSLGEIMVLAHASALAQAGTNVIVLIDEQDGRDRAAREQGWLRRSAAPGQLALWSTKQVLKQAQPGWIAGGFTWQQVYVQMRPFDAGLPPL
ncbi:MAG: hypothetical protein WD794_04115 [Mycobacteriales bacterium]